jgi:hypothetical protein
MDLVTFLDRYGLAVTLLGVIGLALKRGVWPFIVEQVNLFQHERAQERDAFIASLTALQQTAESGHAARAERDRQMADQLHSMASAIAELAIVLREVKAQVTPRSSPRRPRQHTRPTKRAKPINRKRLKR